MVANTTATNATTILFISSDYELTQHGGSKATGCGQDEQVLCHTWGSLLYVSFQVTQKGQAPVTRLLGPPPSPKCNEPSLG